MSDVPDLHNFGALSATAVLGWYAWHTASYTLPNLVRAFLEEMTALRSECAAEREVLHADLADERRSRHDDQLLIAAALRDLADRLPRAEPPRS